MKVAIITARSGSKRIKNKNIKNFCGSPIIEIVIKKLKKLKVFDRIIVSTDSNKISKIAKRSGAWVPFKRSKKLSGDFIGTYEVVLDVINNLKKNHNIKPDIVCCVYPTAVFFDKKELLKGFNKLKNKKTEYVFTATKVNSSLFRSFFYKKNKFKMFNEKYYNFRTQDLPDLYYDVGQFYLAKTEVWLKQKRIFSKYSKIIEMPKNKSYDIDNIDDWKIAEKLFLING